MAFDWLFGPRAKQLTGSMPGYVITRSRVLDTDDVLDITRAMQRLVPSGTVDYVARDHRRNGPPRLLTEGEMLAGPSSDRAQLSVSVTDSAIGRVAMIELAQKERPYFSLNGGSGPAVLPEELSDFVDLLERLGRPRLSVWRYLAAIPFVIYAVAVASWIWLLSTTRVPTPAGVLGWAALVLLFGLAFTFWRALLPGFSSKYPGHRILDQTRAQTFAARANRHRDLQVGIYTFLGTAVAGVIVLLLTGVLGV